MKIKNNLTDEDETVIVHLWQTKKPQRQTLRLFVSEGMVTHSLRARTDSRMNRCPYILIKCSIASFSFRDKSVNVP